LNPVLEAEAAGPQDSKPQTGLPEAGSSRHQSAVKFLQMISKARDRPESKWLDHEWEGL
jgi:hypothetical protein